MLGVTIRKIERKRQESFNQCNHENRSRELNATKPGKNLTASLGEDFAMGDVKVAGSSMRRASHARSPALSLRRIDPYWRSQLLVEYSKDLGACMILDDPDGDDRYIVDDVVIYSYGRIFLTISSGLREKLLHAVHENFFSMHFDAYLALAEEFMWEGIQQDIFQNMERCIARMMIVKMS